MSEIQVLKETELLGVKFGVYGTPEEPLFLLKDIANILGYSEGNSSKLSNLVDDDEKVRNNITTLGGNQQVWFLTEDGLYEVLMQSRKPIAKQFKKGVKIILKEIRTNGGYIATADNDTPEEIMARALIVADRTIKKKEERIKSLEKENLQLSNEKQQVIEETRPSVVFTQAVSGSKSSCLVGELAKIISQNGYPIGERRLFQWMRENGYLGRKGERYNIPNQQYIERGLFELKKGTRSGNNGVMYTTITPKVTGAGQVYFVNRFLSELNKTA